MYVIHSGHISHLKHICDIFGHISQLRHVCDIFHIHVVVDLYDQNVSHTCFS
jgi:hypothetical protein